MHVKILSNFFKANKSVVLSSSKNYKIKVRLGQFSSKPCAVLILVRLKKSMYERLVNL
jgi:hypothetical protein